MAPNLAAALIELRERGNVACDLNRKNAACGGYGRCYPATDITTNARLWVKYCEHPTAADVRGNEPYEVQVLRRLSEMERVPKIVYVIYVEDVRRWLYAMTTVGEHAMNLYHIVKRGMVGDKLPVILRGVYDVMMELLAQGFVQLDLHPGNLVVDCYSLKVMMIDFGAVYPVRGDAYTDHQFGACGRKIYRAPEMSDEFGVVPAKQYAWCFGMIAYFMATCFEPAEDSIYNMLSYLRDTTPLYTLINRCLQADPSARVEFNKIEHYIRHYESSECVRRTGGRGQPNPTGECLRWTL